MISNVNQQNNPNHPIGNQGRPSSTALKNQINKIKTIKWGPIQLKQTSRSLRGRVSPSNSKFARGPSDKTASVLYKILKAQNK